MTNPYTYVDVQRKKSNLPGTGIQYLPGHKDGFVDHCARMIRSDTKAALNILEIGGGGLRLTASILTSTNVNRIHIVDPDEYALDHHAIFNHCRVDQKLYPLFEEKCIATVAAISDYLDALHPDVVFDYVCAFRVFHFFTPAQFAAIARSVSHRLTGSGLFCLSGISFDDHQHDDQPNDLFRYSTPIGNSPNYRRLDLGNPTVSEEVAKQNLGERMLFFDKPFLDRILMPCQLVQVGSEFISTRVVKGYLYKHDDERIDAGSV